MLKKRAIKRILSGKEVSTKIKDELKNEVSSLDKRPCLAVIMVGENQASKVYVRNKILACEYVGIDSVSINIEDTLSIEEIENRLLEKISELNNSPSINGILVQLPLPNGVNVEKIINSISIEKDVDCFHPYNIGKLYNKNTDFKPCTPAGIIEILNHYDIDISGKHCVIIGRSDIVGKPMSQLMLHENATVTVCHSKTVNLEKVTRTADILISAIGIANFVSPNMIKKGATVIDVGINRDSEGKLCGDVDFKALEQVKSNKDVSITPVPGGVGVTTVTMLMKNTVNAYKLQNK